MSGTEEMLNEKNGQTFHIGDRVCYCTSDFWQPMPGVIQEAVIVGFSQCSGVKLLCEHQFLFFRWKRMRWVHIWDLWGVVTDKHKEIEELKKMMEQKG